MYKKVHQSMKVSVDNQGAIALSKHIDIKYHFVREMYVKGMIDIVYCPTEDMVADILTKPPTKCKLDNFKSIVFGCCN